MFVPDHPLNAASGLAFDRDVDSDGPQSYPDAD
jgi:hypothetical protein